jgi:predicted RNA binding protein YcfA (HicA-like mRNA interferase family)
MILWSGTLIKTCRLEKLGVTFWNPLIVTKDAATAIALFEELGFEKHHTKEGISVNNVTYVRMKDANGFHVDITQGEGEWTMIRMNVDNLEEAIAFLEEKGFHKARHKAANETVDTGSSRFNIMVSPSGFIFAVSQHIKDHD